MSTVCPPWTSFAMQRAQAGAFLNHQQGSQWQGSRELEQMRRGKESVRRTLRGWAAKKRHWSYSYGHAAITQDLSKKEFKRQITDNPSATTGIHAAYATSRQDGLIKKDNSLGWSDKDASPLADSRAESRSELPPSIWGEWGVAGRRKTKSARRSAQGEDARQDVEA